MKRNTAKRAKENREYNRRIKIFLQTYTTCPVIKYLKGTNVRTNQTHHCKGRDGQLLLDERFWMAVSTAGHAWIQNNDAEAQRVGFRFLKGYGLHDKLEARICDRRRKLDFYQDEEYDALIKAIKPEYQK